MFCYEDDIHRVAVKKIDMEARADERCVVGTAGGKRRSVGVAVRK